MQLAYTHPSGRQVTPMEAIATAHLLVTKGLPDPLISFDTWLVAKEAQQLEDGTSARITADRLRILAQHRARHGNWPVIRFQLIPNRPTPAEAQRLRISARIQSHLAACRANQADQA